MFQGWRIRLREAEDALGQGRLEEAGRILAADQLRQFLPAQRLSAKVAARMAERARQRVLCGETSAGWRDLEAACRLAGETDELLAVRRELLELCLDDVERWLEAAEPAGALQRIAQLERRRVHEPERDIQIS